uniref:Uncharacterized protein n=1 Tax=Daphnia magna TaxID=35525 RepID=A0A0P5X3R0_9CRUS
MALAFAHWSNATPTHYSSTSVVSFNGPTKSHSSLFPSSHNHRQTRSDFRLRKRTPLSLKKKKKE